MKRILFFFLLTALPFLAAAQGTKQDTVTVLSDAEINAGTLADSVRIYYIQNGWKKSRLDSLAAYMQTKIGGGGISDGDKGDITVSGSGATWTIDNGVITTAKIGSAAVDSTKLAAGAVVLDGAKVTGSLPGTKLATGAVDSTKLLAGAVVLDGAKVTGTLPISKGGTNATTASQARTNLGLAIGTDVLAPNGSAANLTNFPTLNQNTTGSAASLTTARDIQVNLASTSAASFNGTANIQPGVTGTLPIGNGGTGQTTYTDGQLLIGNTATGGLSKATLTAGSNVTITNGNGTITIAATGGGGGGGSGVITGVVAGEVGYGIGADSIGGTGNLFWSAANNRLRVSSDAADTNPVGTMMVKSSGTGTGAALAIENSAGTDRFTILDNGEIDLYNTAVTNNQTNGAAYIVNQTTNGSIVLAPNGTGAFMLDLPITNNAAGGNTRGANAVDLQTARGAAARVASGANSVITGGKDNTSSSTATFIGAGELNIASGGYSSAVAGYGNTASGPTSFVGGGESNSATTEYSAVLGGFTNAASTSSNYSAISGGSSNSSLANYVSIPGGLNSLGYLYGQNTISSGAIATQGDAQSSNLRMRKNIIGIAEDTLTLNGLAYNAGTAGRAILRDAGAADSLRLWNAKIQLVAVVQTTGNGTADSVALGRSFIGNYAVGIKRYNDATSLVGAVQNLHNAQTDAGMGGCVVTIDADDTNEALRIRFTPPSGAGSTTVIRVVATVYLTEVGY